MMKPKGNGSAELDFYTQDPLTVTELTQEIKKTLETSFPPLWVQGEISNFKKHSSGHFYFSLKDSEAQISCVMWKNRSSNLLFQVQDGMKVIILAHLSVYMLQGRYQLNVQQIRPAGIGDLQLEFEKLKRRLAEEGLFSEEHKKAIPLFPGTMGIVTSPTGAALQDIRSVIQRRFPCVKLILWPAKVQGENAAQEIAEGIEAFNQYGNIDVLIVGRGGGSLEDLWPLNEEIVARAIFNSFIPVISAVGHEIDFSISDLVADKRAPTPSAAAEIAVPDREELLQNILQYKNNIIQDLADLFTAYNDFLERVSKSYGFRRPVDKIQEYFLRIDDLSTHLITVMRHNHKIRQSKISNINGRLKALNPRSVLERGYSITTRLPEGSVIHNAQELHKNNMIHTRFAQGSADSLVENVTIEDKG
ncbi:MAG: exodeoxyribonuclease VII large subunit [bacterium]